MGDTPRAKSDQPSSVSLKPHIEVGGAGGAAGAGDGFLRFAGAFLAAFLAAFFGAAFLVAFLAPFFTEAARVAFLATTLGLAFFTEVFLTDFFAEDFLAAAFFAGFLAGDFTICQPLDSFSRHTGARLSARGAADSGPT
jgi:hypothetical protein